MPSIYENTRRKDVLERVEVDPESGQTFRTGRFYKFVRFADSNDTELLSKRKKFIICFRPPDYKARLYKRI